VHEPAFLINEVDGTIDHGCDRLVQKAFLNRGRIQQIIGVDPSEPLTLNCSEAEVQGGVHSALSNFNAYAAGLGYRDGAIDRAAIDDYYVRTTGACVRNRFERRAKRALCVQRGDDYAEVQNSPRDFSFPNRARRVARDDCLRRDILDDNSASRDHGPGPNGDVHADKCLGKHEGPALDCDWPRDKGAV